MEIRRILRERQELLAVGELVLFLAAWTCGVAAAIDNYHERTNANARNSVAVNDPSGSANLFKQRGSFE